KLPSSALTWQSAFSSCMGRACPSTDDVGHERLISNGGPGSLKFQILPRSDDASQAAFRDGLGFDLLSSFENGFGLAEVDVRGGEVSQALVVAVVVVVLDEGRHGFLERSGQVVVLQEDAVLQGLVPAFDLALGLRMPGSATDVIHAPAGKPVGQLPGDVAAAIIAEQPGPADDRGSVAVAARGDQGIFQRGSHVRRLHRRAEPPGDDVAAVVVEDDRASKVSFFDRDLSKASRRISASSVLRPSWRSSSRMRSSNCRTTLLLVTASSSATA